MSIEPDEDPYDSKLIRAAWCRASSTRPDEWSRRRAWVGQSEATAMVLHDYVGGRILTAEVDGEPHFWNLLLDETEVDLCLRGREVPKQVVQVLDIHATLRDVPGCQARYTALRDRLNDVAYVVMMTSDDYAGPEYEA